MIRKLHFGDRLKKVPLRALAIELTKKKKLSGSQPVDILDKAHKSWRHKLSTMLDS